MQKRASITGSTRDNTEDKQDPKLVRMSTEINVSIHNVETTALLDSGRCVSSVIKTFYDKFSKERPIIRLKEILKVERADDSKHLYVGYIDATLTTPGIPKSSSQHCLLLVTQETKYNSKTPILLGTNILNELLIKCKDKLGGTHLQKGSLRNS